MLDKEVQTKMWKHTMNYAAEDSADLDNGCDELQQESRHLEQTREEVVEKVHDEAFDVGTIMILISHDHEVTVPQLLGIVVQLQQIFSLNDWLSKHCGKWYCEAYIVCDGHLASS